MFGELLVPSEEVTEVRKGTKVKSERKFFPGYILVQMTLTDETWHLVRSIPRISDFLGSRGKPRAIPDSEVNKIMKKVEDSIASSSNVADYQIGDTIMVCDGPFTSMQGVIEDVDLEKERVKVSVSIFRRTTNLDLGFFQIEKVV
jgi:transcriptional antiterminator NusG